MSEPEPTAVQAPGPPPMDTVPGTRPLVAQLQEEQRLGWQRGERIEVETYLQQHPTLRTDPEGILDLIYNEVLLREQHGERPQLDEYLRRFPELDRPLREQ